MLWFPRPCVWWGYSQNNNYQHAAREINCAGVEQAFKPSMTITVAKLSSVQYKLPFIHVSWVEVSHSMCCPGLLHVTFIMTINTLNGQKMEEFTEGMFHSGVVEHWADGLCILDNSSPSLTWNGATWLICANGAQQAPIHDGAWSKALNVWARNVSYLGLHHSANVASTLPASAAPAAPAGRYLEAVFRLVPFFQ